MSRRAAQGDTEAKAIKAIQKLEKSRVDWGANELAESCAITVQHARNIIVRLTFRGLLQYREVTVKKVRLSLLTSGLAEVA